MLVCGSSFSFQRWIPIWVTWYQLSEVTVVVAEVVGALTGAACSALFGNLLSQGPRVVARFVLPVGLIFAGVGWALLGVMAPPSLGNPWVQAGPAVFVALLACTHAGNAAAFFSAVVANAGTPNAPRRFRGTLMAMFCASPGVLEAIFSFAFSGTDLRGFFLFLSVATAAGWLPGALFAPGRDPGPPRAKRKPPPDPPSKLSGLTPELSPLLDPEPDPLIAAPAGPVPPSPPPPPEPSEGRPPDKARGRGPTFWLLGTTSTLLQLSGLALLVHAPDQLLGEPLRAVEVSLAGALTCLGLGALSDLATPAREMASRQEGDPDPARPNGRIAAQEDPEDGPASINAAAAAGAAPAHRGCFVPRLLFLSLSGALLLAAHAIRMAAPTSDLPAFCSTVLAAAGCCSVLGQMGSAISWWDGPRVGVHLGWIELAVGLAVVPLEVLLSFLWQPPCAPWCGPLVLLLLALGGLMGAAMLSLVERRTWRRGRSLQLEPRQDPVFPDFDRAPGGSEPSYFPVAGLDLLPYQPIVSPPPLVFRNEDRPVSSTAATSNPPQQDVAEAESPSPPPSPNALVRAAHDKGAQLQYFSNYLRSLRQTLQKMEQAEHPPSRQLIKTPSLEQEKKALEEEGATLLSNPQCQGNFRHKVTKDWKNTVPEKLAKFKARLIYVQGAYDSVDDMRRLAAKLCAVEVSPCNPPGNRIFYAALPPQVFLPALQSVHDGALSTTGWNRVIVEKPFGHDLESSRELSASIARIFQEEHVYRIDHYLGKEMVLNLFILRFANILLQPLWSRQYIKCVLLTFKEPIGTEGRAGYFDQFGIIRDVIQNHVMQMLSLFAMERPVSRNAEDIRNEKVKVLRCIQPATMEDTVVGQFVGNPAKGKQGYLEEPGVPHDSICPTFCSSVLRIRNDRWDGVPFIVKAGKGLDVRKTEIRVQFSDVPASLFAEEAEGPIPRNELVVRIQPDEAIYMKILGKQPGLTSRIQQTELDLTFSSRYRFVKLPEAYERLLSDVIRGDHAGFVRADELEEAWRIFTPLLQELEQKRVRPIPYVFGSRGPEEADELARRNGFVRAEGYHWPAASPTAPTR
ncbi:putative Glucose-6-phosphate 1-dehydrogenase [Paratrimastix pyriformis]|uniref:Glucose-6-phosphate 1-dehydrogenase n=1 Tax=Paratrimastix pyriformis TaxID=342808 RepID=A0ABQ8UN60_9EUKA|nr:putative Glucose-6-phosphate 1-dehydrogenase [Paratrimastix pyriformis]